MSKSYRVRTDVGQDKKVTFELKQDFDLLEILSLSLSQKDVYTRMCADFGVVVGRVVVNNGYGVPNCKVSIFIPLDDDDEDNEIISQLYPYKQPFDKNSDGIRYNLLSTDPTFDCHVAVGSFPTMSDVLRSQDVSYVYKKYYKYTARTNQSGDFMIYGVPIGEQQIIMDVDLSDIGCFSFLPQDFKEKGYPEADFDGPRFKKETEIDSLPQIVNQQQSINISPFWGDEEQCQAAITRVDFDLGNSGVKIEPLSVFMGSTATDTGKDSVNKRCSPRNEQGDLCKLRTRRGLIDCIRYTPFFTEDEKAYGSSPGATFGGTVPVLERYYFSDGGRVIDSGGSFLVHLPMNLDHVITDEFGHLVLSNDPTKGVATRSRVRFRIRPQQSEGGARRRRIGSFLVPNIREFYRSGDDDGDWPGIDRRSYAFSVKYSDYHPFAQQELIPAGKDFFYDMLFNRVYSPAQFHDHLKDGPLGTRGFVGIKQIVPEAKEQCNDNAMPFPVNNALRMFKWSILLSDILITLMAMLYAFLTILVSYIALILGFILTPLLNIMLYVCNFWCKLWEKKINFRLYIKWIIDKTWTLVTFKKFIPTPPKICAKLKVDGFGCAEDCMFYGLRIGFVLFSLRQKKYPDCEKCACRFKATSELDGLATNFECPNAPPSQGATSTTGSPCPVGNASNDSTASGNWEHDCCSGALDELCCPDEYGFDSSIPWPNNVTGAVVVPQDGLAGGGCYVKVICINPDCLVYNMHLRIVREWMRRQKIVSALCKGMMNYFWENNWISGFLYQFQFKAKLKFDAEGYTVPSYAAGTVNADANSGEKYDTYATDSKYCKKIVYLHPTEHTFYYRSTPFRTTTGRFIGDEDGVQGGNNSTNVHAKGDMARHILFPTTITDMGSRNQCIQQICYDSKFGEECSTTDQIGSTSFQNIEDLISDIYDIKMDYPWTIRATLFNRPSKNIGGDVGQALMQNSMVGVVSYKTNMADTDCSCVNTTPSTTPATVPIYPAPNSNYSIYVDHALNAGSPEYDIDWQPLTHTASSQTIMTGQDLIDCLTDELNLSSQEVPYYMWNYHTKSSTATKDFGGVFNDWTGRVGRYKYIYQEDGLGMQLLGLRVYDNKGDYPPLPGLFTTPTDGSGNAKLDKGSFQDNMGSTETGGVIDPSSPGGVVLHYPPLEPESKSGIVFSQGLYYYFGVRPGNTSFNTFVRMYISEELADTVI